MHDGAAMTTPMGSNAPVGVFDSGVGGLSVLRHIRTYLPYENLMYFADSGFAPYGGKPEAAIVARALAIADFLMKQHGAKALVVACNTATAAAIKALRARYPAAPVVGVEPGLKPAAAATKTNTAGVLATAGTLASDKFERLRQQITVSTGVHFLPQPCIGLADQIEKGELRSGETAVLLKRYVLPLLAQGADTLVLGCTHYPFVQPLMEEIIREATNAPVAIVDTGEAVARQLERLLQQHHLRRTEQHEGSLQAFTTGSKTTLATIFANLLKLQPEITAITTDV